MSSVSAVNSLLSSSTSSTSSSSAIDLSSLLSAATGATSTGIDVTSAVSAAIYAAQAPERQWQAQQATVKSQITALTSIQTALSSLSTDLNRLGDLSGPLNARSVSSSSSSVTATAAAGSTLGSHTVSVSKLASAASWYSPSVSSATATLDPMTVTLTAANGATSSYITGGGVNTLSDLAAAINAGGTGVSASVVTDANGARLALVGSSTGSANDFSVTSSNSSFALTRASTAANASLTVDGVPVSSASNTVTGAITGVTLSLSGATSTDSPATLSIAADSSQITSAISTFVTDYNSALSLVNTQFSYSSTSGSQGVLSGDSTMRSLQTTLMGMVGYTPASSTSGTASTATSSLATFGITMGDDGSLTLDTSTLSQAISSNSTAVQNFFQGNALNGFAQTTRTSLSTYTNAATGVLAVSINNLNATYTGLQSQVDDYESGYIASQKTVLTAMYSKAEIALQSLPATLKQLQAQLGDSSGS